MKMEEVSDRRTIPQNRKLWSMLADISAQVKWPVDGELVYMDSWDWKHVFTAALKKHQRVAKGIEGGFVMLGASTSKMNKAEMADLITLMDAFGIERGVKWSEVEPE